MPYAQRAHVQKQNESRTRSRKKEHIPPARSQLSVLRPPHIICIRMKYTYKYFWSFFSPHFRFPLASYLLHSAFLASHVCRQTIYISCNERTIPWCRRTYISTDIRSIQSGINIRCGLYALGRPLHRHHHHHHQRQHHHKYQHRRRRRRRRQCQERTKKAPRTRTLHSSQASKQR